jgi:hypothetical protein
MDASVREVDRPFLGEPKPLDQIPDSVMIKLAGKNICCPGCHAQNFNQDPEFAAFVQPCHTNQLLNEFKHRFPALQPPTQLSLSTKDPEELKRVLLVENAIFCGICPPRGAPTSCIGYKLKRTIFANSTILGERKLAKEKKLAAAERALSKRPGDEQKLKRLEKAQKSVERAAKAQKKADEFVVQG